MSILFEIHGYLVLSLKMYFIITCRGVYGLGWVWTKFKHDIFVQNLNLKSYENSFMFVKD